MRRIVARRAPSWVADAGCVHGVRGAPRNSDTPALTVRALSQVRLRVLAPDLRYRLAKEPLHEEIRRRTDIVGNVAQSSVDPLPPGLARHRRDREVGQAAPVHERRGPCQARASWLRRRSSYRRRRHGTRSCGVDDAVGSGTDHEVVERALVRRGPMHLKTRIDDPAIHRFTLHGEVRTILGDRSLRGRKSRTGGGEASLG